LAAAVVVEPEKVERAVMLREPRPELLALVVEAQEVREEVPPLEVLARPEHPRPITSSEVAEVVVATTLSEVERVAHQVEALAVVK